MDDSLAEVEFLARSENRLAVLRLLARESQTRDSLGAATGASQATLGRILEDFRDRSWIYHEDGVYVATATGRLVAEGMLSLLETLETEQKLRGIVEYLPAEALGFDLDRLAGATITVPTQTRPSAPLERTLELMSAAEELRAFSHTFNERSLGAVTEQVTAGNQTFQGVFAEPAIEALAADETLWGQLTDLARSERAQLRVRPAGIPVAVTVDDETVALLLRDESGVFQATVESADAAVRRWAVDQFERYWETATPVDPAAYASG
jgi:Predicted transcriptional regulator